MADDEKTVETLLEALIRGSLSLLKVYRKMMI